MIAKTQIIEMLKMQIEGNSVIKIAERFNLTKGRVSQILNKEENQRLKQLMIDRIAERTADEIYEENL